MRIHDLSVLVFIVNGSSIAAQVSNDDCANAQELDLILTSPTCWMTGQPSQLVVDSTDLAVPNFPYPTNPGACFGYWAAPNVPANDRWYRFLLFSGHYVEYTCTALDSLQLSWWQGNDCAFLTPLDCSTLLPGETIHRLRPGAYHPGIDTLYLQIASTSISSDARFEFCYRDTWWGTTPITYGTALPTPVLCLVHQMNILPASSSFAADGSIVIGISEGNGPYSIAWADGSTDFYRADLLPGVYPYMISDAQNCLLHDTAFVQVMASTGTPDPETILGPQLSSDESWLYCTAGNEVTGDRIELMDSMGSSFFVSTIQPGRHRLVSLSKAPSTFIIMVVTNPDGTRRTASRHVIPRTP